MSNDKFIFGDIEGVQEGDWYSNRKALSNAGIHAPSVHGIWGRQEKGVVSIVLSGGYEDDEDYGEEIIYTGEGGRKENESKQTFDQPFIRGNLALARNVDSGELVRVTRGSKHKSPHSPKQGYKYGGLYRVERYWSEIGKSGYLIYRYKLTKVEKTNTRRIKTTVSRIIRDTKISNKVKKIYNYQCQICGIQIKTKTNYYAEGAHIKPLGKPYNGDDLENNILCLCPNHHVMLDKGIISIDNNFNIIGIEGKLTVNKKHKINLNNLKYHFDYIYSDKPLNLK